MTTVMETLVSVVGNGRDMVDATRRPSERWSEALGVGTLSAVVRNGRDMDHMRRKPIERWSETIESAKGQEKER